jgi:hypothetical protein
MRLRASQADMFTTRHTVRLVTGVVLHSSTPPVQTVMERGVMLGEQKALLAAEYVTDRGERYWQ